MRTKVNGCVRVHLLVLALNRKYIIFHYSPDRSHLKYILRPLKVDKNCLSEMIEYLNSSQDERGGIIGTSKNFRYITHFYPDCNSSCSSSTYSPNSKNVNNQIKSWIDDGVCFIGFIHSHINGCNILSVDDKRYILKLLNAFPHLPFMWFPLFTRDDGQPMFTFYRCYLKNKLLITQKYI